MMSCFVVRRVFNELLIIVNGNSKNDYLSYPRPVDLPKKRSTHPSWVFCSFWSYYLRNVSNSNLQSQRCSEYQLTSWLNLIGNLSKQIGRFTAFLFFARFSSSVFTTICAGKKSRKSELQMEIAENMLNARSPGDSYALNHSVIFVC